jgi:hypothetical protein
MTAPQYTEEEKLFATLRAAAALGGLEILRTDPADGPVRYLGRWQGVVRELGGDINTVAGFVRVLGGAR